MIHYHHRKNYYLNYQNYYCFCYYGCFVVPYDEPLVHFLRPHDLRPADHRLLGPALLSLNLWHLQYQVEPLFS